MTLEELSVLVELIIVSDPWPLDKHSEEVLKDFANKQSQLHGFHDWIDAAHFDFVDKSPK